MKEHRNKTTGLGPILFCLMTALTAWSCSDNEDEHYPNVITEFADVRSDKDGRLTDFTTDGGATFRIENELTGYVPNRLYRAICGYVAQGERATLYELQGVWILRDSTAIVRHDPTNVLSVWSTDRYLNMQLSPMTHGGQHYWGFATDSLRPAHAYLSLYHNQNGDDAAYSQTVYASLPFDSIPGLQPGDSVSLCIHTFKGTRTFRFKRP
ncbi:MAG: hypothetical protein IJR87_04930 [Bacteroidaceae bacterium]|nr:hypothetical protein [Bacteroidaceae bacterium]